MARPKNDGRGRIGGRKKGTPNKDNPLKEYIRAHSLSYFEPRKQLNKDGTPRTLEFRDRDNILVDKKELTDAQGKPLVMSDFDVDMMMMDCVDRAHAELRLLEFSAAKMKAVDVEMNLSATRTIEDTLAELCGEDDIED